MFKGKIIVSKFFFLLFFLGVVGLFVSSEMTSLFIPVCFYILFLVLITCFDLIWLIGMRNPIQFERIAKEKLNLGEKEQVQLKVKNQSNLPFRFVLYESYPTPIRDRKDKFTGSVSGRGSIEFNYEISPKQRGDLIFENPTFLIFSLFRFVSKRVSIECQTSVKVYPSITQLKKYELAVFKKRNLQVGIKRIRRLGNNSEFEQIKNYENGDDYRTINWKATSRTSSLMVNKYQEEKSQNIICILDKSRMMQMEFDGMTFLDHSVNSILIMSNILIKNEDKVGLITFSDKQGVVISPERNRMQLRLIMDALYNQQTLFKDPNFELLYLTIRNKIKVRSLLLLYTNFETESSLRRALPILRKLNENHILVPILFKNSDLEVLNLKKSQSMREMYESIVVEELVELKYKIVEILKENGIQALLTTPEDLSISVINKYLEIKARGVL